MNKQCKACGSDVPTEARFCQVCGSSQFVIEDDEQTGILTDNPYQPVQNQNTNNQIYNQQPVNTQPAYQQPWQPPVPQNQPKKKKTGLIIAIVAAVLVVLAGIGMVAEKVFQEQGYGYYEDDGDSGYDFNIGGNNSSSNNDDNSSSSNDDIAEAIKYTKGSFDGTTYINDWADIKMVMPAGFQNADSETYSASENSTTECGVYLMAEDSMSIIYIVYEKLPTFPVYDEEDYLDAVVNTLKDPPAGITYETTGITYTTKNIAGYAYAKADFKFNNGYGDFVQSGYARKQDDYMIFVCAIGTSAEANDALVNIISKAN